MTRPTEPRIAIGRRAAIVGSIGTATAAPALLLLAICFCLPAEPIPESPWQWLVQASATAVALRGLGVVARWMTIGPGPVFDRCVWGLAFGTTLALVPAYAYGFYELFLGGTIYFGATLGFWIVLRFATTSSNRDSLPSPMRLGLVDLLVALGALCVVAAAARPMLLGVASAEAEHLRWAIVLSLPISAALLMLTQFVDLGIRFFAVGSEGSDVQALLGIVGFGLWVSVGTGLAHALILGDPALAAVSGFVASYLAIAAAQDEFFARTIEAPGIASRTRGEAR